MLFLQHFLMAPAYAPPITYRSKSTNNGSSSAITKPASVAVGDLVVIFQPQPNTGQDVSTSSGSTWSRLNQNFGGNSYALNWKVLNATDVANAWSFASAVDAYQCVAYVGNGASSVVLKSTDSTTSTALAQAGFTPNAAHRGAISVLADTNNADTPVQPVNWNLRDLASYGGGPTTHVGFADNLGAYQGGTVSWTSLTAASAGGWLFEVT